jgi:ribosomal protein S18 acetylase RimI-like enzyme
MTGLVVLSGKSRYDSLPVMEKRSLTKKLNYIVKHYSSDLVLASMARLAELHTSAMQQAPWHEQWSNAEEGQDIGRYSPALIRHHCQHRADFFAALLAENNKIIGYGIGQHMTSDYLETMVWARLPSLQFCPQVGDYEMALVVVDPAFRRYGVAASLIRSRLAHAVSVSANQQRIWLQTLENVGVDVIKKQYEQQGFTVAGRARLKQTTRVFMSCLVDEVGAAS